MLNELHPVLGEGRYAGLGSPCNTEKQGTCPFEIRTVMAVPFSHLRGFCSHFLALLKALSPHLLLLCSAQLCPAVSVLAWHTSSVEPSAGAALLGCPRCLHCGVGQSRRVIVAFVIIFFVSAVPFCSNFSTKYSVVWFCDFALAVS